MKVLHSEKMLGAKAQYTFCASPCDYIMLTVWSLTTHIWVVLQR